MKFNTAVIVNAITVSSLALALNAIAAPVSQLPEAHKQGEVTYMTGGVGQTEADAIKLVATHYPLELEFLLKAKPKDEYLSDVKIRIKDAHDKMVLDVTANGPFLLAKLPAGRYTVAAQRNRKVEHRQVDISANEHRRIVFEWQS